VLKNGILSSLPEQGAPVSAKVKAAFFIPEKEP
jgi:hypothetical protein